MAKLIRILAASSRGRNRARSRLFGSAKLLSAGIRMTRAAKLSDRLGELEARLLRLEGESGAGKRCPSRQRDVTAQRGITGSGKASSAMSLRLRGELREWLEETVTARITDLELRLQAESERGRKQMLDAFAESVQTRVIQRISRLEEEVAGQSAAMSELRECSLRTEQSMQKLLGGLDKLVVRRSPRRKKP